MIGTYSYEDNKLRLYTNKKLDEEIVVELKALGFKWAPKQELFVAPCWTTKREDLLLRLCGEIEQEQTTLEERSEVKSERLKCYSEKLSLSASRLTDKSNILSECFFMGQPILVGHHSENRMRRNQDRMHNCMRKSIDLSDKAKYYDDKAVDVMKHNAHKMSTTTILNRIKKLEAELRAIKRRAFSIRNDRWMKHLENRIAYEQSVLEKRGYKDPGKQPRKKSSLEPLKNFSQTIQLRSRIKNGYECFEIMKFTRSEWNSTDDALKCVFKSFCGKYRVKCIVHCRKWYQVYITDSKCHDGDII